MHKKGIGICIHTLGYSQIDSRNNNGAAYITPLHVDDKPAGIMNVAPGTKIPANANSLFRL